MVERGRFEEFKERAAGVPLNLTAYVVDGDLHDKWQAGPGGRVSPTWKDSPSLCAYGKNPLWASRGLSDKMAYRPAAIVPAGRKSGSQQRIRVRAVMANTTPHPAVQIRAKGPLSNMASLPSVRVQKKAKRWSRHKLQNLVASASRE